MAWNGTDDGEGSTSSFPSPRRASNPATVAKVVPRTATAEAPAASAIGGSTPAPALETARRSGKKGRSAVALEAPASVIMEAVHALESEALLAEGDAAAAPHHGMRYRFVVRDASDRPWTASGCTIRKHLIPVPGAGSDHAVLNAQIVIVTLDEGGAHDFVGLTGELASSREARLFEYFTFERGGMTHAIPRSGYLLHLKRGSGLLHITRTACEGESIHGAIGRGLLAERAGDTYVCKLG